MDRTYLAYYRGRTIEIKASEIPEGFSAAVLRDATPASPGERL